jgi:GTPase SAR1 family protein
LSFFDTAGEEKYHAVTACHYRNAKGTIIVYDVTNRKSFDKVKVWLNDARQLASKDSIILLLGNKTDVDRYSERSKIR